MLRKLGILTLIVLFVAVSAGAAAKEGRAETKRDHLEAREHGNRFLFHNDNIAVLFHENKNKASPDLRVVFNGSVDDEKSGYRVKLLRLYETEGNDSSFHGGSPSINLAKADDWNVQTTEGNGTLMLTMVRAEAQGIVTLTFHLDTVNSSVKFDLGVQNWRWANATDVLVLDMLVQGKNLKNETGAKVSVEDSGYIAWAETASATYGNATGTLHVDAHRSSVKAEDKDDDVNDTEHEREEARSDHGGHLYLVFNGTGGYKDLQYDPELGVQSSDAKGVPMVAPLIAVAAIGALALVLRRR